MITVLKYLVMLAMIGSIAIKTAAQTAMPDSVCAGVTKMYKVNDSSIPSTYTWMIDGVVQSATTNEITITWKSAGKFLLQVQEHSAGGCDGEIRSGYVYVTEPIPSVRYPLITTLANMPLQLTARNLGNNYKYLWNPQTGLNSYTIKDPVFNYNQPVEYIISISQPDSYCTTTDTLQVKIFENAGIKSSIYLPTAWSPNGDGLNDRLYPLATNISELKFFRIYNRWGQLVFETKTLGLGWDGTINGLSQNTGAYIWVLEATGMDGVHYTLKGTAVLIR
jgi:gliding motility-associated-like protein